MGIATVTATRILDGQRRGESGEENVLSFERFPYTAFSKTYTFDFQVGESAGTITAMMSGAEDAQCRARRRARGDAGTMRRRRSRQHPNAARSRQPIADLSTGVVTTTRITHATPGGTYAHTPSRDWESDVIDARRSAGARLSRHCAAVSRVFSWQRHRRDSRRRPMRCSCRATSPIPRTPINAACAQTDAI